MIITVSDGVCHLPGPRLGIKLAPECEAMAQSVQEASPAMMAGRPSLAPTVFCPRR